VINEQFKILSLITQAPNIYVQIIKKKIPSRVFAENKINQSNN